MLFYFHIRGKYRTEDDKMPKQVVNIGENIAATLDGTILTMTVDLATRLRPSASQKNIVIATTSGNQSVTVGGNVVKVGVNIYTK